MILHTTADAVTVRSDEQGYELFIETDEGDNITVNIQSVVFDFYREVRREIGSYIAEAEMARAEYSQLSDDGDGYAPDDPKSEGYYERMVGDA